MTVQGEILLERAQIMGAKQWGGYGGTIKTLTPVHKPAVRTMAVDEWWRLYWSELFMLDLHVDAIRQEWYTRDPKCTDSLWAIMQRAYHHTLPDGDSALGAIVLHECEHLRRNHFLRSAAIGVAKHCREALKLDPKHRVCRRCMVEAENWNVAADCEINDPMIREGLPLPAKACYSEYFDLEVDSAAEFKFHTLMERYDQRKTGEGGYPGGQGEEEEGQPGQGEEEANGESSEGSGDTEGATGESPGTGEPSDDGDSDGTQRPGAEREGDGTDATEGAGGSGEEAGSDGGSSDSQDGQPEGDGQDAGGQGDESGDGGSDSGTLAGGSGSDGLRRPWEEGPPEQGDTPGLDHGEHQEAIRQLARRIEEVLSQGGGCGKMLAEWSKTIRKPQCATMRKLERMMERAVGQFVMGTGYKTYHRPNRRSGCVDRRVILPSHRKPVPRVVVILDCSGSMSDEDFQVGYGVIAHALRKLPQKDGLTVIAGDTEIGAETAVRDVKQIVARGGGGTDMGLLVVEAAQRKPRPELIVVITDGGTPWCDNVGVKTVACVTRGDQWLGSYPIPDWIEYVDISGRYKES